MIKDYGVNARTRLLKLSLHLQLCLNYSSHIATVFSLKNALSSSRRFVQEPIHNVLKGPEMIGHVYQDASLYLQ